MRVCLISKYPPIEGQVSTVNYWLAEGLAARGHSVIVVTDAMEAESWFRTWTGHIPESGTDTSERVIVLNTRPYDTDQFHIPNNNPIVTKLAALGLDAVDSYGAELIFSHYLEPYAIAGHLACSWTGVPHVVTHSGSDVGKLMRNPVLKPVYQQIIQHAQRFIPKNAEAERLSGIYRSPNVAVSPYSPPSAIFSPDATPLDLNGFLATNRDLIERELNWHTRPCDTDLPTVGIYGKLFDNKGIYELVDALSELHREKLRFNLLIMCRWRRGEDKLRRHIKQRGLEESCWLLPFLPNRYVPNFIRRCRAVCYLEHDWPMATHTSIIPKEVLACGVCLVVSGEVRGRSWYKQKLVDGETCVEVRDPTNIVDLASTLRKILVDSDFCAWIGNAGHELSKTFSSYENYVSGWERVFRDLISG